MNSSVSTAVSVAGDVGQAQRRASNPRESVWVAASAGSGKTKVLADRVTRLLLDGVRPERILCLTFTRAAAAEMSIRLTQRLSRWATCEEEPLEKELKDLQDRAPEPEQKDRARRLFALVLACPGGMRIQTIHAFAQEVLRRFPLEAGLAPHFKVMEEADAGALWREAFDALLEDIAEGREPQAAKAFAYLVGVMGEDTLVKIVKETRGHEVALRRHIKKHGSLEALIRAVRSHLGFGPTETEAGLRTAAAREESFDRPALLQAARLIAEKASTSFRGHAEAILEWLERDETGRSAGLDAYARAYLNGDGEPYAKIANKDLLEKHPEIEPAIKTETARMLGLNERLQTLRIAQETESVLVLSLRMMECFEAKKQALAVLDYDDLIARTNRVLNQPAIAPWVLFKLDGGIDHILVDESQDTSPAQWQIIKALADDYFSGDSARTDRERTLFVVGDEKQSIYSFLKADPEEFARMRDYFERRINAAGKKFNKVPLNVSFRSAPAILRAVDAVFAEDAVRRGVSRDPVVHTAFRAEGAGRVEVWPLFITPEDQKTGKTRAKTPEDWQLPLGYETVHNPVAELAGALARQIKAWLAQGQTVYDRDLKSERPMTPSDVMVIVNRRKPFVDYFVRALKSEGVPVSGVDRMRLTEQLAVMDVMALLQFTLLPEDDLMLATVLRGPFIGASEEDLMRLAIGRSGSLWQSLCAAKDFDAVRNFLDTIAAMADQIAPLVLIARILSEPCPANVVSGRRAIASRLGPDSEDPLDELLSEAEAFGTRHSPSLQAFLHWLLSTEAEIKREMEQASGRVRITTVHSSKGLEAPVVILPDTMRVPERTKIPKILWDEKEGLPFYLPREPLHAGLRTLRTTAYDKQLQEHRRLLYVALTRAADRLYVCGFGTSDAAKETWYNLIALGLKAHHQQEVQIDAAAVLQPAIVIADYAQVNTTQAAASLQAHDKGERPPPQARPLWLFAPPPPEPSPPRPLVPSRPEQEDPPTLSPQDRRFARGRIIHRLLQSLPDIAPENQDFAARRFLDNPQHNLEAHAKDEICAEVMGLIHDPRFAPLFGPDSRAELPIIGLSGARLIAGQVDRLALVEGEVWIVDYKTNRPPPLDPAHIPEAYRSQMEAYRTVLKALYAGHTVRCFLLWTYTLALMEV